MNTDPLTTAAGAPVVDNQNSKPTPCALQAPTADVAVERIPQRPDLLGELVELLSRLSGRKQQAVFEHQSTRALAAEPEVLEQLSSAETKAAVDRLANEFRMVIYYADVEGFDCQEIADIMRTPIATVMSRLHRARPQLRLSLAGLAGQRGLKFEVQQTLQPEEGTP